MIKRKKILAPAALLVAAASAIAFWFGYSGKANEDTPNVLTAMASIGSVEETVLSTGTLKPVKLVAVGAEVSGRVTSVAVTVGDTVSEGDLIAKIDSTTQQNDLSIAQAQLEYMRAQLREKQANLAYAESAADRQQGLLAKNATSQETYESAVETLAITKAQIAALEAQISEAEISVETAKVDLGHTEITAPIDGTVLWVVTQEGQTVNATQSAPTIVILGQVDTMRVRAEISEVDIVKVSSGQTLWFTILGNPSRRYEATLQSIEPAPASITSDSAVTSSSSSSSTASSTSEAIYYNGIFDVPNPDGVLKTYMTAEVHIVVGQAQNVLTIPSAALVSRNDDGTYQVRVLGTAGTITTQTVEIGLNDDVTAEVISGLSEGDQVITGEVTAESMAGGGRPSPMGF